MNITVEKDLPLEDIQTQLADTTRLRGEPLQLVQACKQLAWEKPARIWTFRMETTPPTSRIEAFMDRFECVFGVHESEGDYQSAWWTVPGEENRPFIMKGLFTDLNPSTGPGFFKRAGDGPRIAIWFGRIQNVLTACDQ